MIQSVLMMGGLGIILGTILAVASKLFYVYVDPMVEAIDDALPGANCGGCGLPGCSANAEAIVKGSATPDSCIAGGDELTDTICMLLGVSVEAKEPDIALPGCTYGNQDADLKYAYNGLNDCRAVALLGGGMKECTIGCLGLGTCERACPFDAIKMGEDNLPVVDEEKCTGCASCEKVCPKHIITLSSKTRRILKEYTVEDCTTPCQRACPAGINISEYIRLAGEGDYEGSLQVIKERNPFPSTIGRICPRPCEENCRRVLLDETVGINYLKRFVADREKQGGVRVMPFKAPDTHRKIAVIGGGVQGLSTAYFLARLGHAPTVFEAEEKLGGLLRSAIDPHRLPAEYLDWDIQGILEMGVIPAVGKALGRDFTVDSLLKDGHEAVFLATGGWDDRLVRKSGKAIAQLLPSFYLLIDVLTAAGLSKDSFTLGPKVVIAGGGAALVDAVDMFYQKGAQDITVILQQESKEGPMHYRIKEQLVKKGVHFVHNSGITRITGDHDTMTEIEYTEIGTGEKTVIPADALLISSGRFPQLVITRKGASGWNATEAYKMPAAKPGVGFLATGDALSGFPAAIMAVGAGRRAASSIHKIMYDIPLEPLNILTPRCEVQDVNAIHSVASSPRVIMPLVDPRELTFGKDIEQGLTEEMAQTAANRCLRCGLICYEKTKDTVQISA